VPHREILTGLPTPAISERGSSLIVGGGVRWLVQPPTSPQWHPIRDAIPAPWRRGHCDPPPPCPRLRAGPTTTSTPLDPIHPLLAAAGGGPDQSTTPRKRHRYGYVDHDCLISVRGAILPGSYRSSMWIVSTELPRQQYYEMLLNSVGFDVDGPIGESY
jgi:hypothetical protein